MPKAKATPAKKPRERARGSSNLRRALVEQEILDQALALFAERGFAGTTLQDVADALGMSRPALYYYVPSKDALLERLVESLSRRDARALDSIRRRSAPASERLHEMAREIATNAASNPRQSRLLSENRHHLPPALAEADIEAERSIRRSIELVIEQGIRDGEFRVVDPRTAAMSIIGMCIWTAWWDPGAVQPVETARRRAGADSRRVVQGAAGEPRSARTAGRAAAASEAMRLDIGV
jgi:AcrR family transcriptional regulator